MAHSRLWTFADPAPVCWEQKDHGKKSQPCSREMGWISLELYSHSVTLQDSDWFDTDRSCYPNIYQVAPNVIEVLRGTDFRCGFCLGVRSLHPRFS